MPNLVAVDIGCGMETVILGDSNVELQKLDKVVHEPDPAKYAQTQGPVDFPEEESALHLDNLFNLGYMPVELGYGYLPDGCAILANLTDFPGVTVDMFDFWFAWHPIESMRYKIWNRDQHYYCQTMNPEIALNKSLSLRERLFLGEENNPLTLRIENDKISFLENGYT